MTHGESHVTKVGSLAWRVIAWFAFAGLLSLAVRTLRDGLWQGGALMVIAAVICFPPLRGLIVRRLRINLHGIFFGVAAFALLSIGVSLAADQQEHRAKLAEQSEQESIQRRIATARAAAEDEFRLGKFAILTEAQRMADSGDHESAVAKLSRFRFIGDPDLVRIHDASRLFLLRKEIGQGGLADERAAQLYAEIARLDPADKQAKETGEAIAEKLADEKARRVAKAQREQKIQSQFSKWDGSHPAVESAIKSQMKNPDSYAHVETRFSDSGAASFVVITTFRGTNSFNAVVTNTATATVSPDGQVLSLIIR